MAALESISLSVLSTSSSSSRFLSSPKPSPSVNLKFSLSLHSLFLNFPFSLPLLYNPPKNNPFSVLCTAVEEAATEADATPEGVESEEPNFKRKLFVVNLPWSLTAADIKTLFSVCGTVDDVEIIKLNGKSRGFAFVTMSSGEEAKAALEKFDSQEVYKRTIKVEFAKRLRPPPRPAGAGAGVTGKPRHKLFVSNLAWKTRSTDLKDFFSPNFNPVSAKIICKQPTGRSAGYGFVSFATKEEAKAAVSALNGKPLMDRPVQLKLNDNDGESREGDEVSSESQPIES